MFPTLPAIARACRLCRRPYSAAAAEIPKITHSPSILKPGTVLKDLSILKDKPDPVALPDEEYPAWLWTLTDEYAAKRASAAGTAEEQAHTTHQGRAKGFDLKAEKQKLRAKNRADIKSRNFLKAT